MIKPLYKYATIWSILGGASIAYLYLKTLGKNKNLDFNKTILIGSAIGLGLGLGLDLSKKNLLKNISENDLKNKANSIDKSTVDELQSYLSSLNNSNPSEYDKIRFYNVLNSFLEAKGDGKWDTNGNIETKKKVLKAYDVSNSNINFFENILKNNLKDFASKISNNIK